MYQVEPGNGETRHAYLWRIGQAKDAGLTEASWDAVAEQMRKAFGSTATGTSLSREYRIARNFAQDGVFDERRENAQTKEKMALQGERTALRRLIREQQRREGFSEALMRAVGRKIEPLAYEPRKRGPEYKPNDLIVSLTDLHTGIGINNAFNRFDNDVLRERFCAYLDEILDVQARHKSEIARVIISEVISGMIHPTLRIENNEDMIEQFVEATTLISEFLAELSKRFREVHAYICPGNHSRLQANKDLDLPHENLDNLVLYYIKAKLQNYKTVFLHENEVEQSIAVFEARGHLVYAAHGDKDRPQKAVEKLTLFLGRKPDLIYLGHMHTNALLTAYDTKVVQSGCMSGPDEYCMGKRIRSKPEQTVSVVSERGLECVYDVKL